MKYLLILLMFHGTGAPGILQHEFESEKACQDAKTVMLTIPYTSPASVYMYGFCFPTR